MKMIFFQVPFIYLIKSLSHEHEYIWANKILKGLISCLVHCNGLCYREKKYQCRRLHLRTKFQVYILRDNTKHR